MPNFDKTGPNGDGPQTGRKKGVMPIPFGPNNPGRSGKGAGKGAGRGAGRRGR